VSLKGTVMEKKTILLVEDDAAVRDIMKSALEREYNMLDASGCSEALRLLEKSCDIALIDYMLPDGTGLDVLKRVRETKPELPIIIMTAYSSEDVVIKAFRSGTTDYLKKPLSLAYLRIKISGMLTGQQEDEFPEKTVSSEDFFLDGIVAFIEENYSEDLTRDKLAEKVHMDKYKLSKVFNKRFGQGIRSYLNGVRVRKAAELLKNNMELSITEIASSVGYKDVIHFERVFKKIYGISPKDFRIHPVHSQEKGNLWSTE
jgi:YesN/AraC family two-component response regulator